MNKKAFKILCIFLFMVIGIVACNDSFDIDENKVVNVHFTESNTKALSVDCIYEEPENIYWSYTAVKTGEGISKVGETTTPTNISSDKGLDGEHPFSVGTWTFTVWGFKSDEDRIASTTTDIADEKYVYKGSLTTNVVFSTEVVPVSISVAPTTTSGNGTLSLDAYYEYTTNTILKFSTSTDGPWLTETDYNATPGVGIYIGMFVTTPTDLSTTPIMTKQFTVPVYRGLTTQLKDYWDNQKVTVTFDANGGTFGSSGTTVVEEIGGATYTLPANPTRDGYKFKYWATVDEVYQEVDYLQSQGVQYIDTGVLFDSKKMKLETKINTNYANNGVVAFGCRIWKNGKATNGVYLCGGNTFVAADESGGASPSGISQSNEDFTWSFTGYTVVVNNGADYSLKYATPGYSIYLFALNESGKAACYIDGCKIYYFKIYENSTLIRDLVPCKRASDSKPGLYDTANNKFYTNSGTGEFITGSEKGSVEYDKITENTVVKNTKNHTLYAFWEAESYTINFDGNGASGGEAPASKSCTKGGTCTLPENTFIPPTSPTDLTFAGWKDVNGNTYYEGQDITIVGDLTLYAQWESYGSVYTEVSYIKTTNSSNTVDFGVKCNDQLRFITKINMQHIIGNDAIFGHYENDQEDFRFFNSDEKFYLDYGSYGNRISGGSFELNTDYEIEVGNRYVKYLNGSSIISGSAVSFSEKTYTFKYKAYIQSTLYYLKIYNGTTLVRDLIPVKHKNFANLYGLYDKCNKKFYLIKESTVGE